MVVTHGFVAHVCYHEASMCTVVAWIKNTFFFFRFVQIVVPELSTRMWISQSDESAPIVSEIRIENLSTLVVLSP